MPARPAPDPALTRRLLLGAGAALVAAGASGCSFDSLDPTSEDPTITPGAGSSGEGSSGPGDTGDADATDEGADDARLVAGVLATTALADRTALATARAHRELATTLRRVRAVHQDHGTELGGLPEATGRTTRPGDTAAQALARLDRVEARLQRELVAAATAAGSGALAQTFASMAAGVAQLRTALEVTDTGGVG